MHLPAIWNQRNGWEQEICLFSLNLKTRWTKDKWDWEETQPTGKDTNMLTAVAEILKSKNNRRDTEPNRTYS